MREQEKTIIVFQFKRGGGPEPRHQEEKGVEYIGTCDAVNVNMKPWQIKNDNNC